MEFRILGPLEIVGGAPVELNGQRERALLVRLLLSANQVVSSERLIDDVWEEAPPDNPGRALPVYISRLRKALRGGGIDDVVVTCAPGYRLRLAAGDVDAVRFERLVGTGRAEAAAGNAPEASAALTEGLSLWRGPALADVADAAFARAEAARLEEVRLGALEDRIDADLACGRHSALIGELATLVAAHPLRERLWAQRMLALYRAGRQAEALRTYQELRTTLADELGIDPSIGLSRLETSILRHDEELDWHPAGPAGAPPFAHQPAPTDAPAVLPPDGPAAAAVVTFLFTDMVGSTEMLSRLGDDAAEQLRLRHVNLLRAALSAEGGSEVKNLGDGLMVAFASPLAALRCAVAIQQAVEADNRNAGTDVAMRVGLHAGEPLRHEGDYFGTPVVVAKRLCDRAEGGQILASALVRGLAGNRGDFVFRNQGDLVLKGLGEPVSTFEVCWSAPQEAGSSDAVGTDEPKPGSARTVPMPQFLTDVGRIFVGREGDCTRLEQLWKEAAAGDRRVVLLAGEPGVGKTRLAAEVAGRVHRDGAVVLAGRCDEGLGVPYQPFVEALRHFADHIPPGQLRRRLGRHGGELTRLIPDLSEKAGGLPAPLRSDPETERYRLFDAVASWLADASADAPLLAVLDDLQWAAKPTLLLLRHVLRSPEPMRLLVLGTYRDSELTHDHPLVELIADLHRQVGTQRLSLSGLDDLAVAAFVERASGRKLDDDGVALAQAIHAETDGNPFFVREVLRHLTETGAVEKHDGGWVTRRPVEELGIPEGVRDVVGRRLSQLSKDTNRMLRVAAVLGAEFDLAVLQAADVVDEDDLVSTLEEATAARLVVEVGGVPRYRFSHALVRDTVYAGLSAARRTTLHRRVAEAIEVVHRGALDDHLPALAHHWSCAAAPAAETDKAIQYAVQAGDRALRQLAHDEAVSYYRSALDLLDASGGRRDDSRRLELLLALGEAERRGGAASHRETLLDAARLAQERGDADALARAALANYRGFFSVTGTIDAERVAVLQAALDATVSNGDLLRARLLANLAAELHFSGQRSRRRALSDEALTLARQSDDPVTLAHVLQARCTAIWEPSTAHERLKNTEELLSVAERLDDPSIVMWAWSWRFIAAMELTDLEEADRSLDHCTTLIARLRQPVLLWMAAYMRAGRLLLAGRLAEADSAALEAHRLGIVAEQTDAHLFFGTQRYQIRFEQGRLSELVDRLERAVDDHGGPGPRLFLALAYTELDRPGDARRVFEPLSTTVTDYPVHLGWLEVITPSAAVCAQLGDQPLAARLEELLAPYADQLAGTGLLWRGGISHYLGLLATTLERFDDADARFAAAQTIHGRIQAPTWLARTRLEWARMLLLRRKRGDVAQARELLGQALAAARPLGLRNVERRAEQLLS